MEIEDIKECLIGIRMYADSIQELNLVSQGLAIHGILTELEEDGLGSFYLIYKGEKNG